MFAGQRFRILAMFSVMVVVLQIPSFLGIVSPETLSMTVVRSFITVSLLLVMQYTIYRVLPVHLKQGKILATSFDSIQLSNKNSLGVARFFSIRQVPDRLLRNFLLALGNQRYSIIERAAISLGNIGDPRAVEPLIKALGARKDSGRSTLSGVFSNRFCETFS